MSTGGAASARIGFDAVRALRNRTGLGNYARGVLQGLAEVAPNLTQLHYSPQSPRAELADFPASVRASLQLPTVAMQRPIIRQFWRTFRLGHRAARDGVALYHGLTQEIPRDLPGTGIPSLVTAADLLYHTHPELFPRIDRASYSWRYRWSMEHATAIVAISNWTKQQLHQHFGIPLSRIAVVPPARDPRFAMQRTTEELRMVRQRASLPERYIVAVGTLEPRKNQELAIAAMKLLDPSLPPLILIGRDGGSAAVLRSEIERQ